MDVIGKVANKKRLIDANALLLKLKKSHDLFIDAWEGFSNLPEDDKASVDEISNCIADVFNAPTVDAVEVVRCLECKHWHEETGFCEKHSYFVDCDGVCCSPADSPNWTMFDPDDFCSYGERKDGVVNG